MLHFVSCHMKDNVKVIHFDIKARSEQNLVFAQIAFEKDTANFYFENEEVNIKTLISIKRFRIFTHFYTTLHSIRTCFYEISNGFYLEDIFYSREAFHNWYFNFMVTFTTFNKGKLSKIWVK